MLKYIVIINNYNNYNSFIMDHPSVTAENPDKTVEDPIVTAENPIVTEIQEIISFLKENPTQNGDRVPSSKELALKAFICHFLVSYSLPEQALKPLSDMIFGMLMSKDDMPGIMVFKRDMLCDKGAIKLIFHAIIEFFIFIKNEEFYVSHLKIPLVAEIKVHNKLGGCCELCEYEYNSVEFEDYTKIPRINGALYLVIVKRSFYVQNKPMFEMNTRMNNSRYDIHTLNQLGERVTVIATPDPKCKKEKIRRLILREFLSFELSDDIIIRSVLMLDESYRQNAQLRIHLQVPTIVWNAVPALEASLYCRVIEPSV
jgi:hypothetical protein